ncbi:hypothetical protein [Citrobacter arsenatis]|uniref:hypothetical protein n=1 Tax=Citrobacter arsenatis TaxID=2546350 RepID=UPI001FE69F8A|nr:hypothetical protein [Citrobacter arsenatis]
MTSREKFEAWMTDEQWFHGSDFEWDERRNCYAKFGIHLAYKAFLAAEGAAEQRLTDLAVQLANAESKCRELAAELSAVDKIHNEAVFITDDHYEQCPPEVQKMIRSLAVLQIPACDAFLAEVRAQGVEMFALQQSHIAVEQEQDGDYEFSRHCSISATEAREFAEELREGKCCEVQS